MFNLVAFEPYNLILDVVCWFKTGVALVLLHASLFWWHQQASNQSYAKKIHHKWSKHQQENFLKFSDR